MKAASALAILLLCSVAAGALAAEPVPVPKPVYFATGSTRGTIGGHVLRGARDLYSLKALKGQTLTVTLTAPDDNAVFQIYEPDTTIERDEDGVLDFKGKPLTAAGADATRWSGPLPRTGTYIVAIGSTRGNARYSMDVKIE